MEIPEKCNLEHIAQGVYTDGRFAYKFNFSRNSEVLALIKAKGLSGVQQYVAVKNNVLVTDLIEGKDCRCGGVNPTQKQLEDFIDNYVAFYKEGLWFEPKPKNLMFSPDKGFTMIDLDILGEGRELGLNSLVTIITDVTIGKEQRVDYNNDTRFASKKSVDIYNFVIKRLFKLDPTLARKEVLIDGLNPRITKHGDFLNLEQEDREFQDLKKIMKEHYNFDLLPPSEYRTKKEEPCPKKEICQNLPCVTGSKYGSGYEFDNQIK